MGILAEKSKMQGSLENKIHYSGDFNFVWT